MSGEGGSVPAFGLADVEERESAVVLVSAGETRRCACGRVKLGDLVAHREDACLPMTLGTGVAVTVGGFFPAPLVTSRDPWDGVTGAPGPVLKLAESASAASWIVGVQRSRGSAPHASHGAPGAVKWRYAVRLGRAGANAYAVHDGSAWKSVMLWGDARTWFALASVTDLEEYIRAGGMMDDSWYDAIRERIAASKERAAERERCNRGNHVAGLVERETLGPMYGWWCGRCRNTWSLTGEPWKATKSGKKEGMA